MFAGATGCGLVLDLDPTDAGRRRMRVDAGTDGGITDGGAPTDSIASVDAEPVPCVEVEIRLTTTELLDEARPTIAPAGDGFAVAWHESPGEATTVRWIAQDGTSRGEERVEQPATRASLASNASRLFLAVEANSAMRLFAFSAAPGPLPAGSMYSEPLSNVAWPSTAADGGGWVVVWRQSPSVGLPRVLLHTWDASGVMAASTPAIVSENELQADEPRVAVAGGAYLVVWDENERALTGEPRVRWAWLPRADPSRGFGGALGVVSDDGAVAASTDSFAAVWIEKSVEYPLTLQFFEIDGSLRGTTESLTSSAQYRDEPAIAWNGAHWAIAFEQGSDANVDEAIELVTVAPDGAVLGSWRVSTGDAYAQDPAIAWNSSGWGVTWMDLRDGNPEIYYAHVCP